MLQVFRKSQTFSQSSNQDFGQDIDKIDGFIMSQNDENESMIKSFDSNEFKITQKMAVISNEINKEDQKMKMLDKFEVEVRPFKVLEVKNQDLIGYE